jgi:hypothetical protein
MFFEWWQIGLMLAVFAYGLKYTYTQGYYQACIEVAEGTITVEKYEDDD